MKLMFVTSDNVIQLDSQNLSTFSLVQDNIHENIQNLIPQINPDPNIGFDWNQWYAGYVLTYTEPFFDLMKIIYSLYEGRDVLIIIPLFFKEKIELLTRFLYHRYGLVASYIYEANDTEFVNDTEFSVAGLEALDADKDRLTRIYKNAEPFVSIPQCPKQALYTI